MGLRQQFVLFIIHNQTKLLIKQVKYWLRRRRMFCSFFDHSIEPVSLSKTTTVFNIRLASYMLVCCEPHDHLMRCLLFMITIRRNGE